MDTPSNNLTTDTEETKPSGLGSFLRAEREKRHITIEQVASATKISTKLLHALENDNFSELPAKPFVRGFVTSYSRYLNIDPAEVLNRYSGFLEEKISVKFNRPADAPHIFVGKETTADNSKTILGIVMTGFLVVAATSYFILKPTLKSRHHRGVAKENSQITNDQLYTVTAPPAAGGATIAAVTPAAAATTAKPATTPAPTTKTPAPTTTTAATKAPPSPATPAASVSTPATPPKKEKPPSVVLATKPEPTKAPASVTPPTEAPAAQKWPTIPPSEVHQMLVVQANEDSWIKYQADDFPLRQYTLKKGQKIFIRARSNIRFRCFKVNGVQLSYDNKEFKPLPTTLTMVLPKEQSDHFKEKPFTE